MKQRIDSDIACGERSGMRASGSASRCSSSRFHRYDWLSPTHSFSDTSKSSRVAKRFQVEKDRLDPLILLPVNEQIVAGYIGLVSNAYKMREAKLALVSE